MTTPDTDPPTDLRQLLVPYTPFDADEAADVRALQDFLSHTENAYSRTNQIAHVVADAWILDPSFENVVLLKHAVHAAMGLDVWIAPGGHCDGNPDVQAGAAREAREECGLDVRALGVGLLDIATSQVPLRTSRHGTEPAHTHFDVCFAFTADASLPLVISDESRSLAWIPIASLTRENHWHGHWRRVQKTRARWGPLAYTPRS